MEKRNKKPTFEHTGLASPIAEYAVALLASYNQDYFASGTATIIGKQIAVTAKHVIHDFFNRFENVDLPSWSYNTQFSLQVFQSLENGKSGAIWDVTRIWPLENSDLAVLYLTHGQYSPRSHIWNRIIINIQLPEIGGRIAAFGHSDVAIDLKQSQRTLRYVSNPRTAIGEIVEVHPAYRDQSRLNFPCFRTNARFDGSMSGGPVFNDHGEMVGLICSNLPPVSHDQDHVSYVTLLWPLLQAKVLLNDDGTLSDKSQSLYHLARAGLIDVRGLDDVTFESDILNNRTNWFFRHG